jgi:hypothetical protein
MDLYPQGFKANPGLELVNTFGVSALIETVARGWFVGYCCPCVGNEVDHSFHTAVCGIRFITSKISSRSCRFRELPFDVLLEVPVYKTIQA